MNISRKTRLVTAIATAAIVLVSGFATAPRAHAAYLEGETCKGAYVYAKMLTGVCLDWINYAPPSPYYTALRVRIWNPDGGTTSRNLTADVWAPSGRGVAYGIQVPDDRTATRFVGVSGRGTTKVQINAQYIPTVCIYLRPGSAAIFQDMCKV